MCPVWVLRNHEGRTTPTRANHKTSPKSCRLGKVPLPSVTSGMGGCASTPKAADSEGGDSSSADALGKPPSPMKQEDGETPVREPTGRRASFSDAPPKEVTVETAARESRGGNVGFNVDAGAPERESFRNSRGSKRISADLEREFQKSDETSLDPELAATLKTLFEKMDVDGDGTITKDEAIKFWGKNFAKVRLPCQHHSGPRRAPLNAFVRARVLASRR